MQQLNEILKNADYQPIFTIGIGAAGLVAGAVILIVLLHTVQLLGYSTPVYRSKKPIQGWDKHFYAASFVMIIFLLLLMWLLNAWRHTLPR